MDRNSLASDEDNRDVSIQPGYKTAKKNQKKSQNTKTPETIETLDKQDQEVLGCKLSCIIIWNITLHEDCFQIQLKP